MNIKSLRKINNSKRFFISLIIFFIIIVAIFIPVKKYILNKGNVNKNLPSNTDLKTASDKTRNIPNENKINTSNSDKHNENEDKNLNKDSANKNNQTANSTTNNPSTNSNTNSTTSINNKDFFSTDLFLGDSITEGISAYEFLDESNVTGVKGLNTISAINEVNKLEKLNHRNIYILLGLNDLDSGVNSEQYAKNYANLIHVIKEKFPNSKIYVQSILQVTARAEQRDPRVANSRVNDFNAALQSMAKSENINFIDIMQIVRNANKDLYEPDGEHFKCEFYNLWLNFLKDNVK